MRPPSSSAHARCSCRQSASASEIIDRNATNVRLGVERERPGDGDVQG